ncbi:Rap1a/Tai family immunity protein [Rhizobium sp. LEGMi198b]
MKKTPIFAALACAAVAIPAAPAFAGFADGNQLYGWRSAINPLNVEDCHAYISGVVDPMSLFEASGKSCIRLGVTVQQVTDIVVRSLRERPENRDQSAAVLVNNAILNAFCPGASK